jgi:arylsulfatase
MRYTIAGLALLSALSIGNALHADDDRPNILLIIGDDMGFSDLGAYGSEVATPNLDALAREGSRFTNFHVGATCSPTRSLLLSGVDNHLNGMGNMHEFLTPEQKGNPGYEGYLNKRVVTITNLMRDSGYRTSMAGKWHLGSEPGYRPHDRGFDRTFALMQGAGDNYASISAGKVEGNTSTFTANGEVVERPADVHSNTLYTDKLIEFLEKDRNSDKPFFAYLSFQTAHWPHQAPKEFVEKYRSMYEAGWDVIREQRIERLRQLGIVSKDHPVSPRFPGVPAWEDLPAEHKQVQAYRMAAYAGMIEHMDSQIGRLFRHLKETGEFDNTVIIYLTDNGPDFSQPNLAAAEWYNERYPKTSPDEIGLRGSFSSYGPPWAQVAAAHLSGFKTFSTEGGLRVPLVIQYPKWTYGSQIDEFVFVTDLAATILEIAGGTHPGTQYKGREVFPMSAKSCLPLLKGETGNHRSPEEWVGYELMGNAAVFKGDYKAVRLGEWVKTFGAPGVGEWKLYNLKQDPSELRDLSKEQPELLAQLVGHYDKYGERVGVLEMPADFNPLKMITGGE